MKYPSYTTPLTEQNFVAAYSLLSTLSVAEEHLVPFQSSTPSWPAVAGVEAVPTHPDNARNRVAAAFVGNECWKPDSLLFYDWSNPTMVALPEETAFAPLVFNSGDRWIAEKVSYPQPAINGFPWVNRYTTAFADLSNPGLPFSFSITPAFSSKYLSDQQLFDAVRMLLLNNSERDGRIAGRLTTLYQDAIMEGQSLLPDSIKQFAEFFLIHFDLGMPKITLTPDGTLRARWIHGQNDFASIEFTGTQVVRFVAEIPRARGLTARYFSSELIESVLPAAIALGSSFS
jgi:hypothetical protein